MCPMGALCGHGVVPREAHDQADGSGTFSRRVVHIGWRESADMKASLKPGKERWLSKLRGDEPERTTDHRYFLYHTREQAETDDP